ncbi:MAG: type VI secretion system protein TssL, long form [Gammaproteobacteria bacterium]
MNTNNTMPPADTNVDPEGEATSNDNTVVKPRATTTPPSQGNAKPTSSVAPSSSEKTRIQPRSRRQAAPPADDHSVQPNITALEDGTIIKPRHRPVPVRPAPKAKNLTYRNAKIRAPETQETLEPHTSALLSAAQPILGIVPELRQCTEDTDLKALRSTVNATLKRFQAQLRATVDTDTLREHSSYILCALIDETVITSPWGEHSDWSRHPLLSEFHGEAYGGERFFQILEHALQAPRAHTDLLEIIYFSLMLGFRGALRLDANGDTKVQQYCQEIYDLLPDTRRKQSHFSTDSPLLSTITLSRAWQSFTPLWIIVATLVLIAFCIHTYLHLSSTKKTEAVLYDLAHLVAPPAGPTLSDVTARPEVTHLTQRLAEEIQQGVLRVTEYTTHTEIALIDSQLFPSGSTDIAESAHPVLYKIAKVLEGLPGKIVVSGHTDDQDIKTPQYPSNWHLSLARAAAIVRYLEAQSTLSGRIVPEGRGADQPITRDGTPEARARNRRVVIEWYYGGES